MSVESIITENLDIWTSAIKTKSASGRGSSSKLELYGIKKLRELILELAVTGKLLKANPNELSKKAAIEEFEIAKALKLEMINSGRASKTRGVSENEGGVIHSGYNESWETCLLDDIAWPQAGFAFKSNSFNENGVGLPIIRIRDVGNEFSGTFYDGVYRDEFLVSKGDILVSMDGEFRVRRWKNNNALLNQRVSRIHFVESVDCKFFELALQIALRSLQGAKSYTTVDHLSTKQIGSSKLPFPPISEQKEIVNRVDELMSLCDELESQTEASVEAHQTLVKSLLETLTNVKDADELNESWQRISAHFDVLFTTEDSIDQLKQTILQLAVMGKLVKQDPNDEPASKLLERIAAEKEQLIKDKKIKKQKPLPQISKEAVMDNLPKGGDVGRINDISVILDPNPSHRYPSYENGSVPLLSTREFSGEDGWQIRDAKLVPEDFYQYQKDLCDFNYRDLVFARKGRLGLARKLPDFDKFTFSHTVFIVKPLNEMNEDFLLVLFKRNKFIDGLMDEMNANVGVPTLGKAKLESMALGIPPKEEQFRIVKEVEKLMKLCDSISEKVSSLTILQNELANTLALEIFEEKQ